MFSFDPLRESDLPFVLEVRNECRNLLHDDRCFTLADAREWFQRERPEFWLIRYEGQRIGYFRLSNRNSLDRSIYVGADLHVEYRGRGLARAAYEDFLDLLKRRESISVARLEVLSHNVRAHSLYKSLGFVEIDRKTAVGVRDGAQVDSIVMERRL